MPLTGVPGAGVLDEPGVAGASALARPEVGAVSYTHLTLPTNREV